MEGRTWHGCSVEIIAYLIGNKCGGIMYEVLQAQPNNPASATRPPATEQVEPKQGNHRPPENRPHDPRSDDSCINFYPTHHRALCAKESILLPTPSSPARLTNAPPPRSTPPYLPSNNLTFADTPRAERVDYLDGGSTELPARC